MQSKIRYNEKETREKDTGQIRSNVSNVYFYDNVDNALKTLKGASNTPALVETRDIEATSLMSPQEDHMPVKTHILNTFEQPFQIITRTDKSTEKSMGRDFNKPITKETTSLGTRSKETVGVNVQSTINTLEEKEKSQADNATVKFQHDRYSPSEEIKVNKKLW